MGNPSWQFHPHIVRRAEQTALSQCATEEEQLAQTDGTDWAIDPAAKPTLAIYLQLSHDLILTRRVPMPAAMVEDLEKTTIDMEAGPSIPSPRRLGRSRGGEPAASHATRL